MLTTDNICWQVFPGRPGACCWLQTRQPGACCGLQTWPPGACCELLTRPLGACCELRTRPLGIRHAEPPTPMVAPYGSANDYGKTPTLTMPM
ncbi:hypothetical protein HMPREF0868_0332 [Mageeibacillus indolicus UPII9-5]|uniref:Uncharacterized protein n=1 Tax=Mageeibacillus indolicus (strain UPII9-5) TaxID=699246 RepID=D3R0G3_MAGIU|nr:hypothetical protein HMPREF0868_0332 [Mageeibacillus indolicus UPII9-5]